MVLMDGPPCCMAGCMGDAPTDSLLTVCFHYVHGTSWPRSGALGLAVYIAALATVAICEWDCGVSIRLEMAMCGNRLGFIFWGLF